MTKSAPPTDSADPSPPVAPTDPSPPAAPPDPSSWRVLQSVEHDGVRYAPASDRPAIPADAITREQLAALVAAGVVTAA